MRRETTSPPQDEQAAYTCVIIQDNALLDIRDQQVVALALALCVSRDFIAVALNTLANLLDDVHAESRGLFTQAVELAVS